MFKGKTAIVTGGARGIGFAIAKELASLGAQVVICSRTEEQVKSAVNSLSTDGKRAFGITADVSKFGDCQKLVDFAVSQTGKIDILVNNAGIFGPVGLLEMNDPEAWVNVLGVNILGVVYCSKLVIPYMKKQGYGKIVSISGAGIGGPKPLPRFSSYYTTKGAIACFTEVLAAELQEFNIQVNAIAPGAVASELTLGLLKLDKAEVGEDMYEMSRQLEEKGGTPPEIAAKLIAFLASGESDHVTGRLFSAKWDPIEGLKKADDLGANKYRLRRVDGVMIFEEEKK